MGGDTLRPQKHSRWLQWIAVAGMVGVLGWALYWVVAFYWLDRAMTECSNKVLAQSTSPDQRFTVTAFRRSCGATTPFITAVTIRPAGIKDEPLMDAWLFGAEAEGNVSVRWVDDESLELRVPVVPWKKVSTQVIIWNGIRVSYGMP